MYQITVNKEQLLLISSALELQSRILIGQLNQLEPLFWNKKYDSDVVNMLTKNLKAQFFPELKIDEYWGIYSKSADNKAKIGYDLYKQMQAKINNTPNFTEFTDKRNKINIDII